MKPEEIALRMEIRQMLSEAGINRNTLKDMAKDVLHQEIEKQVRQAMSDTYVVQLVRDNMKTYMFRDIIKDAVREQVSKSVNIKIDVTSTIDENKLRGETEC